MSDLPGTPLEQCIKWLEANIRIALMALGKDEETVRQVLTEALEDAEAIMMRDPYGGDHGKRHQ
jgi:hypothetical protein